MAKLKKSTFERLNSGLMNRIERRKLARQVAAADPGLSIINPHAAGIDVGNASHLVAGPPERDPKKRKQGKPRGNEPQLNLKAELERICGVDLTWIDGVSTISALTIVSKIGTDMSRFKDEDHFASWLGLTGGKNITGGKPVRGPKRKVKNRVAEVLRMGATSLLNSDGYLGARYRHLRWKTKTPAIAVKAMARYLAVLIYRLLTKGQAWVDRGAARFEQKRAQRDIAALQTMSASTRLATRAPRPDQIRADSTPAPGSRRVPEVSYFRTCAFP